MIRELKTTVGRLLSGPAPLAGLDEELKLLRPDMIWNLAAELNSLITAESEIAEVIHSPVFDGYSPLDKMEFSNQVDTICEKLKCYKTVYVHCMGGQGRTGLALACILIRLESMQPNQALMITKRHCSGPSSSGQVEFVYQFCR